MIHRKTVGSPCLRISTPIGTVRNSPTKTGMTSRHRAMRSTGIVTGIDGRASMMTMTISAVLGP